MLQKTVMGGILGLLITALAFGGSVRVPFGTTGYCELDERVTSKKKETNTGDWVKAHVWKDVWVDGQLVIERGTPIVVRVGSFRKARVAGTRGRLNLEAINVTAVDGTELPLIGGHDGSGKGKVGLAVGLALAVAWPLIFLKGKQVILEPGTVFDAEVRSSVDVEPSEALAMPEPNVEDHDFTVAVLYDRMDPDKKIKELPLSLRSAGGPMSHAEIVAVNGMQIEPVPVELTASDREGDYVGTTRFKPLSRNFRKGMNLFSVQCGDHTAEVLLEVEL